MTAVYALLAYVLMICVIVTVHEFGHYAAGRAFGLVGTTFSLGFGPRLIGCRDRRGTDWRLSAILLGGYVSFPGDDPKKPVADDAVTLARLPRWKRAIVVGAGPAINLVLSAVLFATIAGGWGYPVGRPIVQDVAPGSTAQALGMREGDVIRRLGTTRIVTSDDVTRAVALFPGRTIEALWERDGRRMEGRARLGTSTFDDGDGSTASIGVLGVVLPHAWSRATGPLDAMTRGVGDGVFMTWAQIETLRQIVTGERSVREMSGPIRIARASARTFSMGTMPFLYLMAMISIAVGVVNLMPVPVMDGGHLATYAIEGAMGRDISDGTRRVAMRIGLAMLIALGILGLTLDLLSLA